ncbi:retinal short-chain dehydrogenase reductase [Fusarium phyllophilum]|uniref:Short-chain dehydrogenase/reductase 3 n=1 Tax=Fusarium phyllophilum TaxID=47803 RepID=A0A8H5K358_9HYPO|nr:retinal short-chain dehydrogenase reductase [Fusarium phyllophilum]
MSSMLYSPVIAYVSNASNFLLSPLLSGSLLAAATFAPDAVSNALASMAAKLPDHASHTLELTIVKKVLYVWLSLGIVRTINRFLNTMAHNSWRMTAAPGWDWKNEIAVVTGGSSGIGLSIVEKLSAMGIRVAVFDVQDLPKQLQTNSRVHFYRCDVTTTESVAEAADAVRKELGHPSILINNAGITSPMSILKMPESFLRKIMGVNLMALWYTTQQFLPRMIQLNKGHVITVASIASFVALATAADYSATKAGALAFHESLASEIKHFYKAPNVLTTVVHPNFVRTPLVEGFVDRLERGGVRLLTADDIAKEVVAQIKSRRGGQLIVPKSVDVISGIRGWPTWLQEVVRDAVGKTAGN